MHAYRTHTCGALTAADATLPARLSGWVHSKRDHGAFTDQSPTPDGSKQRSFASFNAAADEAAISRLYGGIHFRPAIENGKAFGRCIAAHSIALVTRA